MKKLIIAAALLFGSAVVYSAPLQTLDTLQKKKKKTTETVVYSTRCQAITRNGTQCKRNARSKGYCWQHGGK